MCVMCVKFFLYYVVCKIILKLSSLWMLSVACEFFLKLFFLFFSLSWSLSRLLLLPFNTVCATFFSVFALNDSLLSTYPVAATHERNYFLIFHHFISFMPSADKRRFFFFCSCIDICFSAGITVRGFQE